MVLSHQGKRKTHGLYRVAAVLQLLRDLTQLNSLNLQITDVKFGLGAHDSDLLESKPCISIGANTAVGERLMGSWQQMPVSKLVESLEPGLGGKALWIRAFLDNQVYEPLAPAAKFEL